jgi:cullin-associated NEDD8-dissociated protein 1
MDPFLQTVIATAIRYHSYDPNYVRSEETDRPELLEQEEDQTSDENELDDILDDYNDEEDLSWKLRRMSAKLISTAIVTRPDLLCSFCEILAPLLMKHVIDREESVRLENLHALNCLLQTFGEQRVSKSIYQDSLMVLRKHAEVFEKYVTLTIASKSPKIREAMMLTMAEFLRIVQVDSRQLTSCAIPAIIKALHDIKSSVNLKMAALLLTNCILDFWLIQKSWPFHFDLVNLVIHCIQDKNSKVALEALESVNRLIILLSMPEGAGIHRRMTAGFLNSAQLLCKAIMERCLDSRTEQELKSKAVFVLGHIIHVVGSQLTNWKEPFDIILSKMRQEPTRIASLKAMIDILQSDINLSSMAPLLFKEIRPYTRQADRVLRQAALLSLQVLLTWYHHSRHFFHCVIRPCLYSNDLFS